MNASHRRAMAATWSDKETLKLVVLSTHFEVAELNGIQDRRQRNEQQAFFLDCLCLNHKNRSRILCRLLFSELGEELESESEREEQE